jgi:hypothetical protein
MTDHHAYRINFRDVHTPFKEFMTEVEMVPEHGIMKYRSLKLQMNDHK